MNTIISIILFILGIILIFIGSIFYVNDLNGWKSRIRGPILIGTGLLFLIVWITLLGIKDEMQEMRNYENAQNMIQNGCKVYLDGQEVDPDVIILKDYKVTIKDNIIILSHE